MIAKLLSENPSLRSQLAGFIEEAYANGVDLAVAETPLDYPAFPAHCHRSEEQILPDLWPDAAS